MDKIENKEYSEEKQKLILDFLISDEECFNRCQNILDVKYFSQPLRPAVRFILSYANDYKSLPTPQQIYAETETKLESISNITLQHQNWFLDEVEQFCKHKALENAIISSMKLLQNGNYGEVEKKVRDAIVISLQNDLGTNYYDDPKARLLKLRDKKNTVSTGWSTVDDKLYGGQNRGEITIFCANSGVGKSLFLQNQALNWSRMGLTTLYITLELSEALTSMRLDSMVSGVSTKDIFKKLDEVEIKVRQLGNKSGAFYLKQMPQGSSTNDIKALLKTFEIQTHKKPDAILVDYLDLLYPNNKKINPSDMFIKDKHVTEELRGLAVEYNCLMSSASQLNRSGVNEQEHDQSHIAGGISKINTADNVISIYASAAMKERGVYQIQFLKTRSSSGVGSKLQLGFDPNTLRIFDIEQDVIDLPTSTNDIYNELKRKSIVKTDSTNDQVAAEPAIDKTKMQLLDLVRR